MPGGPSFSVTHSIDGAAVHAQRLHGDVDAAGDGFGGVGIDDEDAVGHGAKDGP